MVYMATTQLCHCSSEATTDDTKMHEFSCVPIKFYLHKQMEDWIWLMGCSLLTPDVDNF